MFTLIHARVVGSRLYVATLHDQKWWELWDSLADFSQRCQGIRQESKPGLFYALLCSELMEKVSFSGSEISLISRFQWIISARACCTRKLLRLLSKKTLHSGIELVSEFPKQCLIITKALFCRVSYCFCLFGEFAKVFERQVWCVRVAHLHSAARALSSLSRCFQDCQQILTKICLVVFCAEMLEQFSPASKGY